jgi:hypothetical protein
MAWTESRLANLLKNLEYSLQSLSRLLAESRGQDFRGTLGFGETLVTVCCLKLSEGCNGRGAGFRGILHAVMLVDCFEEMGTPVSS